MEKLYSVKIIHAWPRNDVGTVIDVVSRHLENRAIGFLQVFEDYDHALAHAGGRAELVVSIETCCDTP